MVDIGDGVTHIVPVIEGCSFPHLTRHVSLFCLMLHTLIFSQAPDRGDKWKREVLCKCSRICSTSHLRYIPHSIPCSGLREGREGIGISMMSSGVVFAGGSTSRGGTSRPAWWTCCSAGGTASTQPRTSTPCAASKSAPAMWLQTTSEGCRQACTSRELWRLCHVLSTTRGYQHSHHILLPPVTYRMLCRS